MEHLDQFLLAGEAFSVSNLAWQRPSGCFEIRGFESPSLLQIELVLRYVYQNPPSLLFASPVIAQQFLSQLEHVPCVVAEFWL